MSDNETAAELMGRIAIGDRTAFEQVYDSHVDAVIASATRRCEDPHEVGDVVAETFLAVWRHAASYDPGRGTVRQWIAGISARAFLDLRRSERRRERLRLRVTGRAELELTDLDGLAEQIDAQRTADAAARAVAGLPARQRVVFELIAVDGLSVGEVAEALGMNPAAVSMRLSRARRVLRLDPQLVALTAPDPDPPPVHLRTPTTTLPPTTLDRLDTTS